MSDTSAVPYQVDLTNCDREPIHILGAIQPAGFLLALSSDWLVARVSANVAAFLGRAPADVIGVPLLDLFANDAVHTLRNRVTMLRGPDGTERMPGIDLLGDGGRFDVAVHLSGGAIVIEAEPAQDDAADATGMLRAMMSRLDRTDELPAFFREGARQVRALTGFDRVMVYRFTPDGSGEVVAEAVRGGLGSLMGLRYPHTDIPAQARALYVRSIFRVIADVGAAAVPIVPLLDEGGRPLDLSLAGLRAVSPVHIEYLANMGVAASLSISIVIDGRLWGLFACHHMTPRLPSLARRGMAELFGQMFAMKLESRERAAIAAYVDRARGVADRLLASVAGDAALLDDPEWLADTLGEVIPSDGVAVSINGRIALAGMTPPEDEFMDLVRALNGTAAGRVYATERIARIVPAASAYAQAAAGLLALPISRSPRDYVVLFRQEIVRTVRWAGDPRDKPLEHGPDGPRLSPRKSFESWSELVRGTSQPFTAAEVGVAETLRATLIEVVLRLSDAAHIERRQAAERQELLIAELNHRVRNILALIRGLVHQTRGASETAEDYVRELEGRIQSLARAHNQITADRWGPAPLKGLIETEAAAYLARRSNRVRTSGPDVLLDPQAFATLALVIHELMTNSAKYGGLSDSGGVVVDWKLDADGDLLIHWREQGGPPVQAPTRQGFGTTIIQRSIPFDLGGKAAVDYKVTGLEAQFCVPRRFVTRGHAEPLRALAPEPEAPPVAGAATSLAGETVLLVEDSLIIAMDAEDMLLRLGAGRVTPAATIRQALEAIERERPSFALLDINLGDQTSMPIAEKLQSLGIPFLFATGYGEQAALPVAFASVPVLQKPYGESAVAAGIAGLPGRAKREG